MATVKRIARDLEWEYEKRVTRGTHRGYGVTVMQVVDLMVRNYTYKRMAVTYDLIRDDQAQALNEFIIEHKKQLKINGFKITPHSLGISVSENFKALNSRNLIEILDLLTEQFLKIGISAPSVCFICDQPTDETVITDAKVRMKAHNSCYQEGMAEIAKNKVPPKYGIGLLGACIGAFVACFIYIMIIFFGWIIPVSMLALGWFAYFGYLLFKGEFGPKAKWIIVGVSIPGMLLTLLLCIAMIAFSWEYTIVEAFQEPEIELGYYTFMSVLFGLAGIASAFGMAKRREG